MYSIHSKMVFRMINTDTKSSNGFESATLKKKFLKPFVGSTGIVSGVHSTKKR